MKQWHKEGEFARYSLCGGDIRFIKAPEFLTPEERDEVESICWRCPVRAECIKDVVENESTGVWCASKFLPEVSLGDSKSQARGKLEEAALIRDELASTVEDELKRRGEF